MTSKGTRGFHDMASANQIKKKKKKIVQFTCLNLFHIKTEFKSCDVTIRNCIKQGCQLSWDECESHAWTLFLTLSNQACKISRINAKHPASISNLTHEGKHNLFFCHFFLKLILIHNLMDTDAKKCKILKYHFFFHVLVPHPKQFLKVDNPA